MANQTSKSNVFVVHGRNEVLRRSMFEFLRAIGLNPIEWSKAISLTGKGSPFIGEILDKAMEQAQAIVVLFSGDDEAKIKDEFLTETDPDYERSFTPQARPNVLFEAGMAFGKYSERTILVQVGSLRPFSDIAGRHIVYLDNTVKSRQDLAQRLANAGCEVDIKGYDWHNTGEFNVRKPTKGTNSSLSKKQPKSNSALVVPNLVQLSKISELQPDEINVLLAITITRRDVLGFCTIGDISLSLPVKINHLRIEHYCESLLKRGFLNRSMFDSSDGKSYSISDEGRNFLIQSNLV